MVRISFASVFAAIQLAWLTSAHITLKDIDSLTSITNDGNEKIRALSLSRIGNPAQEVILNNQDVKDEAEDVSRFDELHLILDTLGSLVIDYRRLSDLFGRGIIQAVECPGKGYLNYETLHFGRQELSCLFGINHEIIASCR
jgi:hypothetical protein